MKLVFDEKALVDLEGIYNWIAKDNAPPRWRWSNACLRASFEWVVPRLPYIVVYEIRAERDEVIVVAVVHGAQNWEDDRSA